MLKLFLWIRRWLPEHIVVQNSIDWGSSWARMNPNPLSPTMCLLSSAGPSWPSWPPCSSLWLSCKSWWFNVLLMKPWPVSFLLLHTACVDAGMRRWVWERSMHGLSLFSLWEEGIHQPRKHRPPVFYFGGALSRLIHPWNSPVNTDLLLHVINSNQWNKCEVLSSLSCTAFYPS